MVEPEPEQELQNDAALAPAPAPNLTQGEYKKCHKIHI
jgi:hypothetical protein